MYRDGTYDSLNNDNAYFAMGHLGGTGRTLWNVFGDASGALEAVEGANLVAVAFTKLDDADTDILTNRHGFAIIDVLLDASGNAESVVLYNPYGEDRTATPDGADDGQWRILPRKSRTLEALPLPTSASSIIKSLFWQATATV